MAKTTNQWVKISGYLFLLGIIVAIIGPWVTAIPSGTILLILGFVIGLLGAFGMGSVSNDDKQMFMLAAIALMVVGSAGAALKDVMYVGSYLAPIVGNIAVLVAPAVVIFAIEAIWKSGSIKYV
ncbi:MAG: hypothetical protein KJ697_01250 [Nanoarchaeota archaeon]|nr:hypothetical protein [Nanoarchaeota archaeon]MBU4124276.1 hypothetical protein [Nanoarchaeota archaeon]